MVSIIHLNKSIQYPPAPFNPSDEYPELSQLSYTFECSGETNDVYTGVRELLRLLNLDADNYNTNRWNPFGDFINPGQDVVIKPNLVLHESKNLIGSNCLTTHASVLRPIIDYTLIALKNTGSIKIVDVPLQEADFEKLINGNGLKSLVDFFNNRSINISLLDLRKEIAYPDVRGFFEKKTKETGDPFGYSIVDLGSRSMLKDLIKEETPRFSVSNYDYREAQNHHNFGKNEYLICNTILNADVIINVPKMKTHCKSGVTLSLKNMIGINGDKSWLPHYRIGSSSKGGDEYKANMIASMHSTVYTYLQGKSKYLWILFWTIWQKIKSLLKNFRLKEDYKTVGGAWQGNDTLWRTIVDLNTIIFYADKMGEISDNKQRQYFSIVEGIVAGEGSGPLRPIPKKANLLTAGYDPVEVDLVTCRMMNINWKKIPQIVGSITKSDLRFTDLNEVDIEISDHVKCDSHIRTTILRDDIVENFTQPFSWEIKYK